jgi:cysteinyl-tRNA synthetase
MALQLYNTLTRRKEEFKPLDPANVRMYVCGPTVYDFAHIGNARPVIVFDVLYRLLRHLYGKDHVTYVRNITDVDDKINARALRDFPNLPLNEAIRHVTEKTATQFHADVKALGCLEPTVEPRATDNIKEMIDIIQRLLDLDFAYVARGEEGRETLFDVRMMKDYGKLSGRSIAQQKAGARIAVEAHKRNPEDFVLWKESKETEPGWHATFRLNENNQRDLQLNTPVEQVVIFGRPGWHIECSAMSNRYLGETFDIHGGGLDLIFPHHENEIAQSRCAFGKPVMANVWMHNGFLQVEGQKMSKSLGNFYTINELLAEDKFHNQSWHGKTLRLAMLMTHYRQPIDWTVERLVEARSLLEAWIKTASGYANSASVPEEVIDALADDINSSALLTVLHGLHQKAKSRLDAKACSDLAAALRFVGLWNDETALEVMGHGNKSTAVTAADVETLISARLEARKAKNWAESDRIRDELAKMGIAIKDNKDGTTSWEVQS